METHTIDAQQKKIGRIASEAAHVLLGKNRPDYEPQKVTGQPVHIINTSKLSIAESKIIGKKYKRYSGFPGGLKHESLKSLHARRGSAEVMRRAVYNMLPSNRLRTDYMKRLEITE